jgi:hypothetical protein
MPKASVGSMSVDALLKLRDDIGKVLSSKVTELRGQLARLEGETGYVNRGRLSRVERSLSNIAMGQGTRGQEEERSRFG